MTTAYDTVRRAMLDSTLAWRTSDLRAALVDSGYVFNRKHATLQDVRPRVLGVSERLDGCEIEGLVAKAEPCFVLTKKEGRASAVIVFRHADGALFAHTAIAPAHAVAGQRFDISWPDGAILSLEED